MNIYYDEEIKKFISEEEYIKNISLNVASEKTLLMKRCGALNIVETQ